MPNIISITDGIDHLRCLTDLGWSKVNVLSVGDPQNYLLSPCCIHGFRLVWSPRPIKHWFVPTSQAKWTGLPNGTDGDVWNWFGSTDWLASGGDANIDTLGLGKFQWTDARGSNTDGWVRNTVEAQWNWNQNTEIAGQGGKSKGGDRPEWFTPGRTIKGAGGSDTSWVLVNGYSGGGSPSNPPFDIKTKWWGTTQQDLSTVEEERAALAGQSYKPGQSVSIRKSGEANENSGLGVTTPLGSSVGGSKPLWILFGGRTFVGVTKCNDGPGHDHPGASNWNGVGMFDQEVFTDILAGPSHEGGMTPEILIYGGDVHGVRAVPVMDENEDSETFGDVLRIDITDPGATVIDLAYVDSIGSQYQGTDSEITPPNITLSTPSNFYSGFDAGIDVSSIFKEMKDAHGDFFKSSSEILSDVVDSYIDPIAQTFMVNASYQDGVFLHSVDVCFTDRPVWGEKSPVILEIRPTVNGFPSAEHILLSSIIEEPEQVNIADGNKSKALRPWDNPNNQTVTGEILPSFDGEWGGDDDVAYTRFELPYPLYLNSGVEYCFVVRSNDSNYKVWVSDVRLPVITSGLISDYDSQNYDDINPAAGRKQYGGSFFRSQNGRTWEADQNLDIMFRLNKCAYTVNDGNPKRATFRAGRGLDGDFTYDRIKADVHLDMVPTETRLSGSLLTYTDASGGTAEVDSGILNYTQELEIKDLNESMKLLTQANEGGTIKAVYELETSSRDVTPQIDTRKMHVTPLKNVIDDGTLSASDITVINGGTGFVDGDEFTISPVESRIGSANAYGEVTVDDGAVTGVVITTPGSGFHRAGAGENVTITSGVGIGQQFQIDLEEGRTGGNAKVRYVTQTINLASGMEARHLRSFATVHKPEGSSIYVYYKVLSAEDTEELSDKKWKIMTQSSPDTDVFNTINVDNVNKYSAYEFNSDEIITYTLEDDVIAVPPTYDTFKSFQMKIVLFAENTAKVPLVRQFRTIAVY